MADCKRWLPLIGVFGVFTALACKTNLTTRDAPDAAVHDAAGQDAPGEDTPTAQDEQDPATPWRDQPLFFNGIRLRARVLDGGGGAVVFQGFRDIALDVDCDDEIAEDNVVRCLPSASGILGSFSDSQCTQPVYVDTGIDGRCPAQPTQPYARAERRWTEQCPESLSFRARAYRVGALRPSDTVYSINSAGDCAPTGWQLCLRDVEKLFFTYYSGSTRCTARHSTSLNGVMPRRARSRSLES